LVDFEALASNEDEVRIRDDQGIRESAKGLEGAEARRVGMKAWLDAVRAGGGEFPGEMWASGRFVVGAVVVVVMFLAGIGVMSGMLDRERMAFHVPMVLGVSVGMQLLILGAAFVAWLLRGRFSKGLGVVPKMLGWLVGKIGGSGKMEWWRELRLEGGRAWEALGWNLVRLTQVCALMFSVGLIVGLLGCIWFMEVEFYWESTTPGWMAKQISRVVVFLSLPWAWAFPNWVPIDDVILGAFWSNGRILDGRMESTATWYKFFFASIFFWGMLPRAVLWAYAVYRERKALGALDFQAKRHRELWREIMGTRRADVSEAPLDGVLVLDVGGTGLKKEDLRGYLLRCLRVNPGEWFEVGVWDGKGEEAAAGSIRKAPAGVVLLAEGWALSPPRMKALHSQIRELAGDRTMIHFLVANAGPEGKPSGVKPGEKEIWREFVDGLADASAEIFFYGEGEA
jgi:hypothetical protein